MSISKAQASSKQLKELLAKLIVDLTESEFHKAIQHDCGGSHLMLYLPDSERNIFDKNAFRKTAHEELGRARIILSFVPTGYIKNFLRT